MAVIAQLVRALDCGSRGRGFKSRWSPFLYISFMSIIEAILLGIIQGLTEFLPVSSSGHLELGQHLLGFTNLDKYIFFDLVCHLGTLVALLVVFAKQIRDIQRSKLLWVIIGTLPLFPLVFFMKPIKDIFNQPQYLGYCFLFTALLLYLGGRVRMPFERKSWRDALVIGVFQAIAILPGISRSGATISAGRLLGWKAEEAATFSFLLAIPAILGGIMLESLHLFKGNQLIFSEVGLLQYICGFLFSLGIGYVALRALMQLAAKDKFVYFVWYCMAIGVVTLVYFNFLT